MTFILVAHPAFLLAFENKSKIFYSLERSLEVSQTHLRVKGERPASWVFRFTRRRCVNATERKNSMACPSFSRRALSSSAEKRSADAVWKSRVRLDDFRRQLRRGYERSDSSRRRGKSEGVINACSFWLHAYFFRVTRKFLYRRKFPKWLRIR